MSIKEEIGRKIATARKNKQLTIRALSEKTKTLSIPRISNWEQGLRSPGPVEAKLLAEHLDVSASYLLGLTSNPSGELPLKISSVPLLPFKNIHAILNDKKMEFDDTQAIIVQPPSNRDYSISNVIATIFLDESMEPDFNKNDLLLIDSKKQPKPGDYVLVLLKEKSQTVFRQYSENNDEKCLFQLIASNPLWPITIIKKKAEAEIIGTLIEHRRCYA
jgi:transcriptional regulator with XRE-family HTH domain